MLDKVQRRNGVRILWEVSRLARAGKWSRVDARRTARLAIMTAMDESGLRNLASAKVSDSLKYPHDGVAPGDHDSVGLFQQRPGWGTVAQRMNPEYATRAFVKRGLELGVTRRSSGVATWLACQRIQVSYDPTGENYRRYRLSAFAFVALHWTFATMTAK